MPLKVEKKTILEVGCYAIDELLSALFMSSFEFEAAEELGDGDVRTFDVKPEEMSDSELEEIKGARGRWLWKTGAMLNHACYLGEIAPGEYVINNRE